MKPTMKWVPAALPEGHVLEFGVGAGTTILQIAAATSKPVHGFDSFEGLPEDWSGTAERRGKFSTGRRVPKVPPHVTLHRGWFEETLPEFLDSHSGPVAFVHVDCDLYSSTRTVLRALASRFVPGSILVFDEYFNYPNWQQHEYRAFQEFVGEFGADYRYLAFTARDGHVAVELVKPGAAA